jgi:flagellar basal-body rod modification protein FlgD
MASLSSSAILGGFDTSQYLQLLVAQLQNQDPLNPVSNSEFLSQLTQLQSVASLGELNANFSQLLKLQQLSQGSSLLGKSVEYSKTGVGFASGTVTAVNSDGKNIFLTVGTDRVALDDIRTII